MTDVQTLSEETLDRKLVRGLALVVGLAALADWLFYGHRLGLSLVIFIVALEAGALVANPIRAERRRMLEAAAVFIAALAPLVEALTPLALLIAIAGAAYFALVVTPWISESLPSRMIAALWLVVAGPFQVLADLPGAWGSLRRGGGTTLVTNAVSVWVVPVAFGAIFVGLFAAANPLIETWFAQLALRDSMARLDAARVLFWVAMLAIAWPFVCLNRRFREEAQHLLQQVEFETTTTPGLTRLFGQAAILRSLILFNLLFAAQTAMDINYLWGGAALPHGVSYAEYAHRGAYPLIVTALLAAAFVIAAMRPGSGAERSRATRVLVFMWVGQNVMLVISSMLRLDLYVATYSLTYWRAAAFVWMLLVAIGLVLIVVRIVSDRSDAWLIGANLVALVLALYVCAFINFPHVIASYNVAHSFEVSGQGQPLDLDYLLSLGPDALAAIDQYGAQRTSLPYVLQGPRARLAAAHLDAMQDWRAWSFRGWRLKRYLEEYARGAA